MANELLSTKEAAVRLGVTPMRVRALIQAGRLPSQLVGRDHVIKESDLALVAERKAGRPRKEESALLSAEAIHAEPPSTVHTLPTANWRNARRRRSTK